MLNEISESENRSLSRRDFLGGTAAILLNGSIFAGGYSWYKLHQAEKLTEQQMSILFPTTPDEKQIEEAKAHIHDYITAIAQSDVKSSSYSDNPPLIVNDSEHIVFQDTVRQGVEEVVSDSNGVAMWKRVIKLSGVTAVLGGISAYGAIIENDLNSPKDEDLPKSPEE